ncbi:zinc finger BED domain-containing protein 4-like [Discoglossus pictus]
MDLSEELKNDTGNYSHEHRMANGDGERKTSDSCNPLLMHPRGSNTQTEDIRELVGCLMRPGTRTKTSMVWNFFHIDPQYACRATCNLCRKSVSRGKRVSQLGTSTLQRHLQARHPVDWTAAQNPGQQGTKEVERDFISDEDSIGSYDGDRNGCKFNLSSDTYSPDTICSKDPIGKVKQNGEMNLLGTVLDDHCVPHRLADSEEQLLELSSPDQNRDRTVHSLVWELFDIVPSRPSYATCLICKQTVCRGRKGKHHGVSILQRHLQSNHPSQWGAVSTHVWNSVKDRDELPMDSQVDAMMDVNNVAGSEDSTMERHLDGSKVKNAKTNGNTRLANTILVPQVHGRKRKIVSPVWVFFIRDPQQPSHAICRLCNKSVSRGRLGTQLGTSTLQRHLIAKHPEPWELVSNHQHNIRDLIGKPLSLFLSKTPAVCKTQLIQPSRTNMQQHRRRFVKTSTNSEKQSPLKRKKVTRPSRVKRSSVLAVRNNSPTKKLLQPKKSCRRKRLGTQSLVPLTSSSAPKDKDDALGNQGKVPHKRVKRVTSPVWKLFYIDPFCSSHAVCIVCSRSVSRGKPGTQLGTSTLQRHLLAKHPLQWNSVQGLD